MSEPLVLLFVVLGACAGTAHFAAISRDADLRLQGGSALIALGLRSGRVLLTVAVLAAAARQGWPMLLGATIGFMAARQVVLRRLCNAT